MADTREIWVDIKNYEGKYKISNLGRVKSLERQVSHDGITWIQPERIMCHWCGTTSLYDCVRLYKAVSGRSSPCTVWWHSTSCPTGIRDWR